MGKIIAIGGGHIGETYDGKTYPVTTLSIDKEIIRLSGKKNPKLLFIPTASSDSKSYVEIIDKHFGKRLKRDVNVLYLYRENPSKNIIRKRILSSDIIYVGGGNTLKMMNRWRKLGVDKILLEAYKKNKVLSGLSAGAICWFKYGNSDSWKSYNKNRPYIKVKCLGLIDALLCPHYSDPKNDEARDLKKMMKKTSGIAIGLDSNCAIEVIDDKYRIISSQKNAGAYKIYWKNQKFYHEKIHAVKEFKLIMELFKK